MMHNVVVNREIPSDEQLVARVRTGDPDAFAALIQRHHNTCFNLAISILRDRTQAQDELQKAYCQAFSHLAQFQVGRDANSFLAWLLRIVKNQCLMFLRVRRRMPLVHIDTYNSEGRRPLQLAAKTVDAEQGLMKRQMIEVMRREICRIPPILRNVLLMSDIEERPVTDVAEHLQISVAAAKSRLLRARRELRKRVIVHCVARQTA